MSICIILKHMHTSSCQCCSSSCVLSPPHSTQPIGEQMFCPMHTWRQLRTAAGNIEPPLRSRLWSYMHKDLSSHQFHRRTYDDSHLSSIRPLFEQVELRPENALDSNHHYTPLKRYDFDSKHLKNTLKNDQA